MIKGYIGLLGKGKTLNMVGELMKLMIDGRRVISNTPIDFVHKGKEYHAEFLNDGLQFQSALLNESNATFAIDEASIFFPSQFWNKLTGAYIMKFAQARKYGVDIYYTSQGWNHTIKRIRDLTNLVVKCTAWRIPFTQLQIFDATTYDPEFFAQRIISTPSVEKKYILGRNRLYPSQYKKIMRAYQTMHRVQASALTSINEDDVSTI